MLPPPSTSLPPALNRRHGGAGLAQPVEVLAAPDHVVERVAGRVEAADGVALGDELVDHIVEDDRVLEPGVAFRDDDRALVALRDAGVEERRPPHPAPPVGARDRHVAASRSVGRRRHVDRRRVERELRGERPGAVLVDDEVFAKRRLGGLRVSELLVKRLEIDLFPPPERTSVTACVPSSSWPSMPPRVCVKRYIE